MERDELLQKHCALLKTISALPKRIVAMHGNENSSEFVLNELCNKQCFDLPKAAYFIDNPDFDCFKGITGFCKIDLGEQNVIDWQNPHFFTTTMQSSPFNRSVRSIVRPSYKKIKTNDQGMVKELASELGFNEHAYCAWPLKHQNNGLLLFEKNDKHDQFVEDHLMDALSLLSFCPVF